MIVCGKTCIVGLLICSIFCGKKCTSASVRVLFSSEKSNDLTDQQDVFCFNHASTFYTSNNIEKMLIDNIFEEAQSLTGNPTERSRCHALASRAFNMSRGCGQSARSVESRCVVSGLNVRRITSYMVPYETFAPQNLVSRFEWCRPIKSELERPMQLLKNAWLCGFHFVGSW